MRRTKPGKLTFSLTLAIVRAYILYSFFGLHAAGMGDRGDPPQKGLLSTRQVLALAQLKRDAGVPDHRCSAVSAAKRAWE